MLHTVMAFLPLAFLIVYALKTRKMADAMLLATLLAVLLVHHQHFFTGLIDAMYILHWATAPISLHCAVFWALAE